MRLLLFKYRSYIIKQLLTAQLPVIRKQVLDSSLHATSANKNQATITPITIIGTSLNAPLILRFPRSLKVTGSDKFQFMQLPSSVDRYTRSTAAAAGMKRQNRNLFLLCNHHHRCMSMSLDISLARS